MVIPMEVNRYVRLFIKYPQIIVTKLVIFELKAFHPI